MIMLYFKHTKYYHHISSLGSHSKPLMDTIHCRVEENGVLEIFYIVLGILFVLGILYAVLFSFYICLSYTHTHTHEWGENIRAIGMV